jgi:hypothetical protein
MIESNESGTVVTGPDIEIYKVLAIRRGLILKVDTGMSLTRVSCLSVARRDGLTSARTGRAALKDVNEWLTARGASAVWSKTYPEG